MPSFNALLSYVPLRGFRNAVIAIFLTSVPVFGQTLTLLAYGDSLTAGFGLPPEQGFVPQLQTYLRAQGDDVTVINAGVSGDTTAGGAARLDWMLTPEVDAVIINLGGNDMLRGLPPAQALANMDKIAGTIAARGLPMLIIAMQAPPNYGAEYKTAFDAIYPAIASKYGALLSQPYFTPITGGDPDPSKAAAFMQPDGIHPNATGVAKLVAGHGPQIHDLLAQIGK